MKKTLLLLLGLFILNGPATHAQDVTYTTVKDISYRPDATDEYQKALCKLDLNYPDQKGFPTIIWLHSGGLAHGNKSFPTYTESHGLGVVTVNYRLCPKVKVKDCIEDAAAAVAWVVKHIKEYGGDPKKIFISGASAGGYLTTMIGMDKRWLKPHGIDPDTTFVAMIPYSGQSITHFARRKEMGYKFNQPYVDDMAPMYYVRPDCVPILILSGDRELEMSGRYEENAYFYRMLKVVGHKDVQIKEFDGFSHNNMDYPANYVAIEYVLDRLKKMEKGNK